MIPILPLARRGRGKKGKSYHEKRKGGEVFLYPASLHQKEEGEGRMWKTSFSCSLLEEKRAHEDGKKGSSTLYLFHRFVNLSRRGKGEVEERKGKKSYRLLPLLDSWPSPGGGGEKGVGKEGGENLQPSHWKGGRGGGGRRKRGGKRKREQPLSRSHDPHVKKEGGKGDWWEMGKGGGHPLHSLSIG